MNGLVPYDPSGSLSPCRASRNRAERLQQAQSTIFQAGHAWIGSHCGSRDLGNAVSKRGSPGGCQAPRQCANRIPGQRQTDRRRIRRKGLILSEAGLTGRYRARHRARTSDRMWAVSCRTPDGEVRPRLAAPQSAGHGSRSLHEHQRLQIAAECAAGNSHPRRRR